MLISKIMEKMIAFSEGNIHDIDHLIRVWTYARTMGELEGLDGETQLVLEAAAIVHDIACPLCREKYGNTNGKHQETEGAPMAKEFLADSGLTDGQIERVAYLVGHHHTLSDIEGMDHQILIEADALVNLRENNASWHDIYYTYQIFFQTEAGKARMKELYFNNTVQEEQKP